MLKIFSQNGSVKRKMSDRGWLLSLLALPVLALLNGCSQSVQDYQKSGPVLDLQSYFSGPSTAWGMVQDYQGRVTRRFCVSLHGQWQQDATGSHGQLTEHFIFDDGEKTERVWSLRRSGTGQYQGTAADVVGVASGESAGFALRWQYQLQLKIDGSDYVFNLDDWMYQLDSYRLFNRTAMKKFGVTVAELTLFFDKELPLRQCPAPIPASPASIAT